MARFNLYTTLIGIISVLFVLTVYSSAFNFVLKILLTALGVGVFLHSAWLLYSAKVNRQVLKITKSKKLIRKIFLLDEEERVIKDWDLYGRVSVIVGKDVGENSVDIDLSQSPYAAMIDVEHAVLNYADGDWFIEDLDSRNGISIKKFGQNRIYKLSSTEPCKLDFGDTILIGNCHLRVAD